MYRSVEPVPPDATQSDSRTSDRMGSARLSPQGIWLGDRRTRCGLPSDYTASLRPCLPSRAQRTESTGRYHTLGPPQHSPGWRGAAALAERWPGRPRLRARRHRNGRLRLDRRWRLPPLPSLGPRATNRRSRGGARGPDPTGRPTQCSRRRDRPARRMGMAGPRNAPLGRAANRESTHQRAGQHGMGTHGTARHAGDRPAAAPAPDAGRWPGVPGVRRPVRPFPPAMGSASGSVVRAPGRSSSPSIPTESPCSTPCAPVPPQPTSRD